jgi:NitT/TauT family transport system permease protein
MQQTTLPATPSTSAARPPRRWSAARRRRARQETLRVLACQVLVLAVLLGLWQWGTRGASINAFLFGSPSAIAGDLVTMASDGSLWTDARVTGLETLGGFALGNLLGTAIGLSLWFSRFVSRVVQPFVLALGSVPIVALAPIAIIWFGTGFASKLAMATLSVVVVALVIAYKGALGVDPDQINLMRSLGATRRQIFRLLVLPSSLTDIFAGLKLTVGFALVGAIVGEFMSSSEGLGHAIFKAGSLYAIAKVFAALTVTVALALVFSAVVSRIERALLPWRHDLN